MNRSARTKLTRFWAAMGFAAYGALSFFYIIDAPAGLSPLAWLISAFLLYTLSDLVGYDMTERRLPNSGTLSLLLAGLVLPFIPGGMGPGLMEALLGVLFGGGTILLLWYLFHKLRGVDAVGMGDVKLIAAMGAWFGPAALPPIWMFAAVMGLAFYYISRLFIKQPKAEKESVDNQDFLTSSQAIPFGPFLAVAFWLAWLVELELGASQFFAIF